MSENEMLEEIKSLSPSEEAILTMLVRYQNLKAELEKEKEKNKELKEYKHDAELTKVACCTAQNCEALNNCIKLERELQNADKKWKDKIKAKIEEINKEMLNEENSLELFYRKKYCKEVLQSLLEKE